MILRLARRGVLVLSFAAIATPLAAQSPRPQGGPADGGPSDSGPRRGPPLDKIAQDLGIPVDTVRSAFEEVGPPPRGQNGPPSEGQMAAHAQKLAAALNVPAEKLQAVLEKYRPANPPQRQ